MSTPGEKFGRWLRAAVFRSERGAPATRVELRQIINGAPGTKLIDWPIGELDSGEIGGGPNIDDIAQEAEGYCYSDAEGSIGVQSYCLVAYYGKDPSPGARSPRVMIRPEPAEGMAEGFDSEPATRDGHSAQMMRQNEGMYRSTIGSMGAIIDAQQRHILAMARESERAIEARLKYVAELEELASQRHERDLEVLRETKRLEMQGELVEQVKILGPTIVNRMTGKNLLPEKTDPDLEIVMRVMGTLNSEQVTAIMKGLNPSQVADFSALYELLSKHGIERRAETREGLIKLIESIDRDVFRYICGHLQPAQQIGFSELYGKFSRKPEGAPNGARVN